MPSDSPYKAFMLQAIRLAQRAKWQARPNPCVGALLILDGQVVAEGWHKGMGLSHAEAEVIDLANSKQIDLTKCTLVVTLEPCNHYGQNPPCTEKILKSGIKTVVIGARDPNPKAAGGIEKLQHAGVTVITGIAEQECLDLIADFSTWQTTHYPYTVLKLASTIDGRIATRSGHSQWITSTSTRQTVHELRRYMDAIIVGGHTFYQDNPQLTCRLPSQKASTKQPMAVIVTSKLPEPTYPAYLIEQRPTETIFFTNQAAAASSKASALKNIGIRVVGLDLQKQTQQDTHVTLDLAQGMEWLRAELGCLYVLCEGGGKLGLSMLEQRLVQEMHLHLAPKILGDNKATALFDGKSPETLEDALQLRITQAKINDGDLLLELRQTSRHNTQS